MNNKLENDSTIDSKANQPKIFSSLQLEKTKIKSDDDFDIINDNEINIRNSAYSEDNLSQSPKKNNTNLIKSSIIIENEKSENKSIWNSMANKISNLTNNLKYNLVTTNSYVNFNKLKYVRLFGRTYTEEEIKYGVLNDYLQTIFQFTYRSDFAIIKYDYLNYNSDCGWGCMIRAAQMMLSKCIFENKVYLYLKERENLNKNENSSNNFNSIGNLCESTINRLKYETLILFMDNYIKIEEILDNKDFDFFFQHFSTILSEEEKFLQKEKFLLNKQKEEEENNKKDDDRIMSNSEYLRREETFKYNNIHNENEINSVNINNNDNILFYVTEVTPPFSIQNICKSATHFEKGAGIWFSDVIMSSIFCEINNQFKAITNLELIHFNDGIINEEIIFQNCFEELKCLDTCPENNQVDLINNDTDYHPEHFEENLIKINQKLEKLNIQNSICKKCEEFYNKNKTENNILKKGNKFYKFQKGGVLFCSVRLGLDSISKEYFESIRHIFRIPNNLGIIGGKRNSALYFIGEHSDKLIYLDPHVNQKAVKDIKSLLIESEFHSYTSKYFYEINLKNISPAFTAAFYFRSITEYENLLEDFKTHLSFNHQVFKFREINQKKSNSTKKLKVFDDINEEDDFCIVDYEDEL